MLETIREFGLEELATRGEAAAVRVAHAAWCLDLAELAAPAWFTPEQKQWGDRLEAEHNNVRAALGWLTESAGIAACLPLIVALWPFWFLRSHLTEGRGWLERALVGSVGSRTTERVRTLNGAASIAVFQGDEPQAVAWCEESLAIAREIGDTFGAGNALLVLGLAALSQGDYDRANHVTEAALAVMRDLGDTVASAAPTASSLLKNLAVVALRQGDDPRATRLAEEALALQRELGWVWAAAQTLFVLATIARNRGDATRATALYQESLRLAWDERDQRLMIWPLAGLAIVAAEAGQADGAARLFGAAARLHELLGTPLDPAEQPNHDRAVAATRALLGGDGFEAAWATGQALPLEDAVAEASRFEVTAIAPAPSPLVDPAAQLGLTRREREVLRLLIVGHTNREIAEALFISRRTAETHVTGILNKLGLDSRAGVAAYAVRHGLV